MSSNPASGSHTSPTPHNVPNAALYGATIAFAKPAAKTKQVIQYNRAAIARAPDSSRGTVVGNRTTQLFSGDATNSRQKLPSQIPSTGPTKRNSATTPNGPVAGLLSSPATVAAVVSAQRQVNKRVGTDGAHDQMTSRRLQDVGNHDGVEELPVQSLTPQPSEGTSTDQTSIPPTTSLIKLFEEQAGGSTKTKTIAEKPRGTERSSRKMEASLVVAPKPQRTKSQPSVSEGASSTRRALHERKEYPKIEVNGLDTTKPDVPAPRRGAKKLTASKGPANLSAEIASPVNHGKPHFHPEDTTRPTALNRSLSPPTLPRRYSVSPGKLNQEQSLRRMMPHMTGDSLANAMVGAHLAVSRNGSPARSHSSSRQPSPQRPVTLRHTLRREPSDEDSKSDDRHKKLKHLVHKAPNKHHEGTRKHWRDKVTERERKRYEGVWAANKGMHISSGNPEDLREPGSNEVLNLVARDVWSRSRLPNAVLEEVWFLVDRREVGRLTKEEFVVGLWLIDQQLKGRKLPARVSDSVWNSVTGLGTRGVKIMKLDVTWPGFSPVVVATKFDFQKFAPGDPGQPLRNTIVSMEAEDVYLLQAYHELNPQRHLDELTNEPSPLEFMRYVARNRPFVIRGGAKEWYACKHWNVGYLRRLMEGLNVQVAVTERGNADSVIELDSRLVFVKPYEAEQAFEEVTDRIISQEHNADSTAIYYAQTQNDNLRSEYSPLFSDVPSSIAFARIALDRHPDAINFWLGNSRSVTALHKDPYENIYVQVCGRKHFVLLPPVEAACVREVELPAATYVLDGGGDLRNGNVKLVPRLDEPSATVPFATWDPDEPETWATEFSKLSRPLRVSLGPGDMLYLPALWYHKVSQSCDEDGICVAVNYWYDMDYQGSFWPLCSFARNIATARSEGKN